MPSYHHFFLTAALLTLSLGAGAQATTPPAVGKRALTTRHGQVPVAPQRLPLEVLPTGHIVVNATVNGVAGRFFLDTGAGVTVLTQQFAQRVPGLQRQDGRFTGFRAIGDRLDLPLYAAPTITVGRYVAAKANCCVYAGEMGGVDGLLSLTAFRHQPFTIEYDRHQLVLETPASLAQRRQLGKGIPLLLDDTYGQSLDIAAYCRVNEKLTLLVELDSGSPSGQYWFNAALAPQLGIDTAALGPANRFVLPSELVAANRNVSYWATLTSLTPVAQPTIQLANVPFRLISGLIHDGILPLSWLGNQLTIDLPHQLLFAQ
ncbi:MAG: retropepsin-like aspartic protease [Janthinobacterium lividum]